MMKTEHRVHLAAWAIALAVVGCAGFAKSTVPPALEPAAGESLAMVVAAKGVQGYECRAK